MSVVVPPQQQFLSLPPAALFTDTPSRHPCKITVPSAERRFLYNPYKGLRAPTLAQGGDEDDDDDDNVADDAIGAALAKEAATVQTPNPRMSQAQLSASPAHSVATMPSPAGSDAFRPFQPVAPQTVGEYYASPIVQVPSSSSARLVKDGPCLRMVPGSIAYITARFKFSESTFYVPISERAGLAVGDLVVVQGDRGEDIGTVTADVTSMYGFDPNPSTLHVLRRALNKDRKRYFAARRKEVYAAKIAADLAKEGNLQMTVLDCEFQADLQKLTIFYRPAVEGLIDFRQLQRSLFKHFRCRIWLLNWDSEFQQILEQHRQTLLLARAASQALPAVPNH